ncbi:MAG: imidazoleglycerol-phosphate dehydratase HisB [Chloroflexi bacterium]|nr:imidazoleglycerol-phosphate dehydratase HisB [Chloroflexota bacterium]MBV9131138.1 imidazoleglycerol-phosphate dehydratase HisB [Chloroflexota bacterium]
MPQPRTAHVRRETRESRVEVILNLDGSGRADIASGIGFLDHMLDSLARHARFDLTVKAEGDLHVDQHHTTEDIGITLGQALNEALAERRGIRRFGDATVPLDEALSQVAIDLGGRPWASIDLPFRGSSIGGLSTEMIPHLLQSFALDGRFALHVRLLAGDNDHHRAEATFKALARALDDATRPDPRLGNEVPSTKGVI